MVKEAEHKKEESVITEFGVTDSDGRICRTRESFWLPTRNGPLESIPKNVLVMVSQRTADELFYSGKAVPEQLGEIFEVLRPTRMVQNGEYLDLATGDILRMGKEEAIPLLRQGVIKERRGEVK